jgi:hypothetical protein
MEFSYRLLHFLGDFIAADFYKWHCLPLLKALHVILDFTERNLEFNVMNNFLKILLLLLSQTVAK